MSSDRRKAYRLQARAVRQEETRRRIVAATSALHEEVGPAQTTVAEIARRAGVQRLTVYNNFPELKDLLGACQRHFLAGHPPPPMVPAGTTHITPQALESALRRLYAWYRENEAMERNVHRDRAVVRELDDLMRQNADPLYEKASDAFAHALASHPQRREAARRLIRVAMDFRTWELIAGFGANDAEIARLLGTAVACAVT
jgi:AcrR family transcriptional regulator